MRASASALAALYGANAQLDLRRLDSGATEAVMVFPYEAAPGLREMAYEGRGG